MNRLALPAPMRRALDLAAEAATHGEVPVGAVVTLDDRIVAEARNGAEAVALTEQHHPDIVFLDIRMPGLTGVDAARQKALAEWEKLDVLMLPTSPTTYTVEAMLADPIVKNSHFGRYTNFANLLDLCALNLPAGSRADGMPFGVSLLVAEKRNPKIEAHGGYMLRDGDTMKILFGDKDYLFSASLDEIEAWLDENTEK